MATITTKIFWNKYKEQENGKHPVSLRVTYQRKRRYYPTRFEFTKKEWQRVEKAERGKYKDIRLKVQAIEKRARDIIADLYPFSWATFERKFTDKQSFTLVFKALMNRAEKLQAKNRLGTAASNVYAAKSLQCFKANLSFIDLTPSLLEDYEDWMLERGRSITTVGMYLRAVRAVFNQAIRRGDVPKAYYPFGDVKNDLYSIPTGKNIKKALTIDQIAQIMAFESDDPVTIQMRDYWIFLYLFNGSNVKDFCRLQYKNIDGGNEIVFERAKTKRKRRTHTKIEATLLPEMGRIIGKYGNTKRSEETYLFPILTKGLSAEEERKRIRLLVAQINRHMKKVAAAIGVPRITTYFARHSYATILKRSGKSIEYISETLGHSSLAITENYLKSFAEETRRENAKALIPQKPNLKILKSS